MKFLIVFVALFALATAAPSDPVETLKSVSVVNEKGYDFTYELSDGTSHHAEGVAKDVGKEEPGIIVHGSYSFVDAKDGHVYTVNYVADENGFQPTGDHLPALPPLIPKKQ